MNYTQSYLEKLTELINKIQTKDIVSLSNALLNCKKKGSSVFIFGNGGSASIAAHVSTDLAKIHKIKSQNFNEANHITCFSNDYGYENWIKKTLEIYVKKDDLTILISSSGKSKNILNAAKFCRKKRIKLITLSGFHSKNLLRQIGDLNFWVNSSNYNLVENTHQIILLTAIDQMRRAKF